MKERLVEIETGDGRMETFVTHPEQDGPFPAVVLYMDVWGIREELYDLARRIATAGYYCLLPDLYYRQGKVRSTYINDQGERISLNRLSKADQDKVLIPLSKLSDRMVVEDTGAIVRFLDQGGEPVKRGGIGSVGYCMGGRHVVQVAVNFPERFIAGASLHGTALVSDRPDSPHTSLAKIRGELYCGFAEFDEHAPLPMVAQFNELMKASPARYTHQIHKGAEHGYALPDRDIYHKQATERDWELIFAMFHRQIPPYSR
ncbi:MAG: dienelactone hydrolase family protein [Alphaproteobacteria bacterium]|nr:dienelactone hydrolase family protein [Alphaproteobacteria bacterium]